MANFWTNPETSPKRSYRFTCTIGGIGTENTWLVTQVKKPSATIGEVSHKYLNHTFYYPGRVEWDTVNVTLVDPVSPSSAGLMANILKGCGYVVPGNNSITDSITKKKATEALKSFVIRQYSNDGSDVVEEWTLRNAFITNVDWGELSYESDDLTNVTLTVRYDWAQLSTGPGDGNQVGSVEIAADGLGNYFAPTTE